MANMMPDITFINRQNFTELFPAFLRDLNDADYVAVDLEFTGIDHESVPDFLKLPEEAFLQKMAAARLFTPFQIGFSMFRGATEQVISAGVDAPGAGATPQSCRDVMRCEANAFYSSGLKGPMLKTMMENWVSKGQVVPRDMERLKETRLEAELACNGVTESTSVFDKLHAFRTLNEIDAVIEIAERWKGYTEAKKRHVSVRNYYCYLLPAPAKGEEDRTVTLSSETVMFLMQNTVDLNKWISEGLFFVSFEDYVKVQQAALCSTEAADHARVVEERAAILRRWINALPFEDVKKQLFSEYSKIVSFARTAPVGDSLEIHLPFLRPPSFEEFDNHIRGLGLRLARRTITKVSPSRYLGVQFARDPSYFGTRLLEALVTATQGSKKPLVLHNGILDLAFLCCAMLREPPRTLTKFKRVIRDMFPVLYDTRTLTGAPSLQKVGTLTGTLKRTYLTLLKRNEQLQIHSTLSFEAAAEASMKEHDAVFDAFMTGSLFLFAQEELAQVGSDFRRLCGITPIHGCVFSINFSDDSDGCLLHPPTAPMYVIRHPPMITLNPEGLRSKLSMVVNSVTFLLNGEYCLVKICDTGCDNTCRQKISALLKQWCESLGIWFMTLDVESKVRAHKINYVNEKAS
ncbi:putative ribonuclease [Trypanosoma rangeli]|uniref:Putative ribonuclease n=1 Tax=Trypanosoma rangeli TaxID=5698 RepID=A0A3R7LZW8_TRYRA|nr:putative ribonuclease [Trypanosoma rangeli]RNF06509.1 putative ribonuclease [Trypanosoma rangeli]|eukprot:RNF06509.1 putative ribonuclease [Trypanosoma rangeli]